ncbi:unnamed protein product [Bursaphelenchus okinawaensis]|uniref:BTB domain-containing protein n=1 Tax=Bursaphelenchus okinawaensis TaxID=465554 RepID=A0A811JRA3_9BILA|nr:unnamed protein product [Bursaphelenchus okinawaensis]CAG9079631.1 unnamed protein product [Bursaphelenchus okinawaensis]
MCSLRHNGPMLEVVEHRNDTVVFNNPRFCSFKVLCGSETVFVSKCFLAQKSPVFASMFTSGMKEDQRGELVMVDDVEAVKAMLLFIHQNTKVDTVNLAMKVIQLAHRYEIKLLMLQCELQLLENICEDRAEECLHLARKLKMDYLTFKCLEVWYTKFTISAAISDFYTEQQEENMSVSYDSDSSY